MHTSPAVAALFVLLASSPAVAAEPAPTSEPPVRYLMEAGFTAPAGIGVAAPSVIGGGFPLITSTTGNLRLGLDLPARFTVLVGIGLASTVDDLMIDLGDGQQVKTSVGTTATVLDVHVRYYFARRPEGFSPYVWAEAQKAFLSSAVSTNDPLIGPDALKKAVDRQLRGRSPFGALAGIGGEYRFASSFGIGARWGLGWWTAHRSEEPQSLGRGAVSGSSKHHIVASQAEVYATMRF